MFNTRTCRSVYLFSQAAQIREIKYRVVSEGHGEIWENSKVRYFYEVRILSGNVFSPAIFFVIGRVTLRAVRRQLFPLRQILFRDCVLPGNDVNRGK